MKAFKLAFALLKIRRLFASLVLLPAILSTLLIAAQILITGVILKASTGSPTKLQDTLSSMRESNLARKLIYGHTDPLPELIVCRWISKTLANGTSIEMPPNEACAPDRLDIAIRTSVPAKFFADDYREIFNGHIERLHICRDCHPDIILSEIAGVWQTNVKSMWGLIVVSFVRFSDSIQKHYIDALRDKEKINVRLGEIYLDSQGFQSGIRLTGAEMLIAIIGNIACLIVITLWLALKAHRKVLDYFCRNGALLPMVAGCGKGTFYGAIWILTAIRVFAFLMASVPLLAYGLYSLAQEEGQGLLAGHDTSYFILWFIGLASSLTLATLIASIADLKHRHTLTSIAYRYIPIAICMLGSLVWLGTFFFDGNYAALLRDFSASLPLFGVTPILTSPVFKLSVDVLIVHTILTLFLIVFCLQQNARWLAAHLEEV